VPLTAQHADAGVLDATVDPLGEDMPWEAIHRARPRAPLTCRECGHRLHAKLSPKGLRFFAHDRAAPDCSLVGETMAHRLLKLQLASAIRDAGWYADLEVAGEGWRADVLATSPDGTKRMAWEAQLAKITLDELQERTSRMEASGVPVCWVTDQDRPWIRAVPAIRVSLPVEPGRRVRATPRSSTGHVPSVSVGALTAGTVSTTLQARVPATVGGPLLYPPWTSESSWQACSPARSERTRSSRAGR